VEPPLHDHAVEIAGGRVKVLDLPPDKAKEVADLVATTDGSSTTSNMTENSRTASNYGAGRRHKPLTAPEYEQSRKGTATALGRDSLYTEGRCSPRAQFAYPRRIRAMLRAARASARARFFGTSESWSMTCIRVALWIQILKS